MEDNALVHINDFVLLDWALYLPDLNPINNIWKFLKDAIHDRFPDLKNLLRNQDALDRLIYAAVVYWNDLEDWLSESVIKFMPRRIEAVMEAVMEAVIEAGVGTPYVNICYSIVRFFFILF